MKSYSVCDYFNPCSTKFDSLKSYRKLTCLQRAVIAVATAILAMFSVGILVAPCFRFLVGRFTPISSTNLPPANNKARMVQASTHAIPTSVSSIQNPVTTDLVKILLTEKMIKEALPEEAIKALGGIKKVLELPVRPYFHMEKQHALLIYHDQKYLNNTANKLNRIWLEVGKSEDTILSDSNFPVDSGKPMIVVCIKQEIEPFKTDEERVQACCDSAFDDDAEEYDDYDENFDSLKRSARAMTYSIEPVPIDSCDVIFRHCFCNSAAREKHKESPSLQSSHVYNNKKNYKFECFWISTISRPYLNQIQNAM
jgi:hypothetical protein